MKAIIVCIILTLVLVFGGCAGERPAPVDTVGLTDTFPEIDPPVTNLPTPDITERTVTGVEFYGAPMEDAPFYADENAAYCYKPGGRRFMIALDDGSFIRPYEAFDGGVCAPSELEKYGLEYDEYASDSPEYAQLYAQYTHTEDYQVLNEAVLSVGYTMDGVDWESGIKLSELKSFFRFIAISDWEREDGLKREFEVYRDPESLKYGDCILVTSEIMKATLEKYFDAEIINNLGDAPVRVDLPYGTEVRGTSFIESGRVQKDENGVYNLKCYGARQPYQGFFKYGYCDVVQRTFDLSVEVNGDGSWRVKYYGPITTYSYGDDELASLVLGTSTLDDLLAIAPEIFPCYPCENETGKIYAVLPCDEGDKLAEFSADGVLEEIRDVSSDY